MADAQIFDIPMLDMEEIMTCLQERVLGDIAANIAPEHLKTPTPGVMMQLCTSILSRMGVEVGSLCQARLHSSMEMKHADTYINTFKLLHVTKLINKLVPMLGNSLTLTDLTTPRWKKVRKFICACINYFKSWEGNVKVWDEKYSKSAATEEEHKKLKEVVSVNEKDILDLKTHHNQHMSRRLELRETTESLRTEIQESHQRKEEKELVKAAVKKNYSEIASSVEKKQRHLDLLNKEKENLLSQVVSSPKRHMEGSHTMVEKKKIWEEKQAEVQAKVLEAERVMSVLESMSQLVNDASQTAKDNKSFRENMKKLASERQGQTYEIENHKLMLVEDTQNTSNLKQQCAASREKLSRMTVRSKQINSEYNSTKTDLTREREDLKSQAGDIHVEVLKAEAEIKSIKKQKDEIQSSHEIFAKDVAGSKQNLMNEMDAYLARMTEKFDNCEVSKIL